MPALVLNIICAVAFGHVMKLASHRRAALLWVGCVNYLVATAICMLVAAWSWPARDVIVTLVTGAWGGVCYLVSLLYYFAAVGRLGMGLATAAIRISVALPVAAAILIWHERLHTAQFAGLALVLVALPLLGSGRFGGAKSGLVLVGGLLLPLFLITGLGQLANRVFSGAAPTANTFLFLASLFGGAGIAALVALAARPIRPQRQDIALGALLGLVNLSTNIFLLLALRQLPSSVVFAISSAGSVVLATLSGVLIWGERPARPALIGVAGAAVAVVLLTR